MRVAISSQNFRTLSGHAGKCRRFLVFRFRYQELPIEVGRIDLPIDMTIHQWDGQGQHPLFEVDHILTASCGEGFIKKMSRRGIGVHISDEKHPIKAAERLQTKLERESLCAD